MFTRLAIDLDRAGNVAGISYELLDSDGPASIWTSSVAPFDTPREALEQLLAEVSTHFGTQTSLF